MPRARHESLGYENFLLTTIEDELRQQRAQLDLASRLGKLGAWRLGLASTAVWWSDEVCAIHEVPAGTSPSLDEAILFYLPHCRDAIRTACQRCFEHGVPYDLELEISTGKGRNRWVRAIGEADRDSSNHTVAIQGAFQDITDSKVSEDKNARLEARLASTLESLDMGFLTVDRDWRITFVNGQLERQAGIAKDSLIGQSLWTGLPGLRDTPFDALLRDAMSKRTSVTAEVFFAPYSAWCVATAHGSGEVLAVYVRDISAQRHAQQQLAQSAASLEARVLARTEELEFARRDAEQASSAKTVFLATMSHEIRTPMNGVIGLVDILRQTQLQPEQTEIVNLLSASAKSLLTIIDNILDISKIEAGRMQLELLPMRLSEEVEEICAILQPSAGIKDVELYLFVDPAMPVLLLGDVTRIRQVLVNLIGNAIKFSSGRGKSGQVWVRAICEKASPEDVKISLEVSDNGIGMEAETLTRLFTAFDQADVSTTRRFGGTGLGLTITHSLVALMGGTIEVCSAPSVGSVFQVRLTLKRCEQVAVSESDKQLLQGITCEIQGRLGSLAGDLSAYLLAAGAKMEASAADSTHVVLILPGQPVASLIRASANREASSRTRFVVLAIDKPHTPEMVNAGFVEMEVRAMSRANLYRAVALAAGRTPTSSGLKPAVVTASRSQRTGVVLVAEDNEMSREVMARQLRLLAYAADFASDGKQALDLWRQNVYAALITDLRMPEMDGYALTAAIRAEEPPGHRLAIIALTANAMPEEVELCRAAGMDDYLTKPLLLEKLRTALEKWVQISPGISPATNAPADLTVLKALIADDPAEIARMVQIFLDGSRKLRIELNWAAINCDGAAAASAAHRLKSNAYSMGAKGLGDWCALIEEAETAPSNGKLNDLVRSMETEAAAVDAYLEGLALVA